MVNVTIDGQRLEVSENTTILEAARSIGIEIPSLCYLKGINEIGACRVCIVEVEGIDRMISSCNNYVEEGMIIYTNSPKVREARKVNVELLLSQHSNKCSFCIRSGNCTLQKVSNDLSILKVPFECNVPEFQWSPRSPLVRDASKCIKCMRCVQVCDKIQTLNIWDVEGTGARTTVDVSKNRKIMDSDCSFCGQCVVHCPTGALSERDEAGLFFDALADPDKTVVVQIAPAVRSAWAEEFDIKEEFATPGRIVAALKRMGVDYVFDTDFSADLTIMEEGYELLERLKNGGGEYPMFTSCCPGWVRFLKSQFPEMTGCLSTAKSPQQMFGAVIKDYYAEKIGVDKNKIYNVSIMPCLAKKSEHKIPVMQSAGVGPDVDLVLTTREFIRIIRAEHLNVASLEEMPFDEPIGEASGAGVIFGATGGVMEAALRTAFAVVEGENPPPDAFKNIRGMKGWREAEFTIGDRTLKVAAASGLGNARKLVNAVKKGDVKYDFVEIMACPGGCAGGGGQPIKERCELAEERARKLYFIDENSKIRFSHENPAVIKLYEEYLGEPLSAKCHELLHTDHYAWEMPLAPERK